MSRRRGFPIVWVLLLSAPVFSGGCQALPAALVGGLRLGAKDEITHEPQYQIGGKSIAVIPFRDDKRTYYESSDGTDLATAVTGEMVKRAKLINPKGPVNLRPAGPARMLFLDQELDPNVWEDVGKHLDAQLVLSGDIRRFTLKDPKTIGILRGTCVVDSFIYDVEKKAVVFVVRGLEVYVPETGAGIAASDIEPERLRAMLLATTALKTVQKFYTYKEKLRPPPARY